MQGFATQGQLRPQNNLKNSPDGWVRGVDAEALDTHSKPPRLPEESSRVVDKAWESTDENAEPSSRGRRAVSVDVSTDRVDDRQHRQYKRSAEVLNSTALDVHGAESKKLKHLSRQESSQLQSECPSSDDFDRGEEKKKKKHKKHKKHKDKDKHKDKSKHKERKSSDPSYDDEPVSQDDDSLQQQSKPSRSQEQDGGRLPDRWKGRLSPYQQGQDERYEGSNKGRPSGGAHGPNGEKRGGRKIEWRPDLLSGK